MTTHRRPANYHPRLVVAVVIGLITALMLPSFHDPLQRLLTAWNAGVWTYIFSMGVLMTRASPERVRAIAEREDNSAAAVLVLLSVSAVLSVAAIALELAGSRDLAPMDRLQHHLFTTVTLVGSWLLFGMVFTTHYAHRFYRADVQQRPLLFPGENQQPDYWDFLYFAFTISIAAQTADVSVVERSLRRVVLAHSVLSFLFNVAIVGLSINIAAGLLG